MTSTIIAQGAEAKIIKNGSVIVKDRVKKGYRLPILDERLRKQRTKKEAKLLEKASKIIPVPKLIKTDEKEKIEMEFIDGLKLSENLDKIKDSKQVCQQIGRNIAKLHDADIIHGDLTTSNMIYVSGKKNPTNNAPQPKEPLSANDHSGKVYFIDFGLGFESSKIEDKAVDLHLIKEALEARHFEHYQEFFNSVLKGYKTSKNSKAVEKRLEAVEKRGRYKNHY